MEFTSLSNLSTARLQLRPLELSDDNEIFVLRSSEIINQYISRKRASDKEEALQFINKVNNNFKKNESLYWGINLNENPQLIGTICLWNFTEDRKTAEIGYELFPEFQGKGIMDEALKKVIKTAFQKIGVNTLEAFTHKNNLRSKGLLLRNNFVHAPDRKDEDDENNIIFVLKK